MADHTAIEWTDATWNPIRGCSMARGSETGGCLNCYAAREAVRHAGAGRPYEGLARMTDNGPRWTGRIQVLDDADHMLQPLRWQRPRLVFVNSMSDLFHETLPFDVVDKIVAVMALAGRHTFQVLTKRPERMAEYLSSRSNSGVMHLEVAAREIGYTFKFETATLLEWPLPNVWWGVSCENQKTLDDRMPHVIRALPNMALAWLSAEPLLGPLDLTRWLPHERDTSQTRSEWYPGLSWVVAGGESGPGARPTNPAWFRTMRDQCQAAVVPFLFKQWGEWLPTDQEGEDGNRPGTPATADRQHLVKQLIGSTAIRVGKKAAGRLLDGVMWNQYPGHTGERVKR